MRWLPFALLLLSASPAEAQCTLEGAADLEEVRIRPRGGAPFAIDLVGHEVAVEISSDARARIRSRGGIAFTGTVARAGVRATVRAETRVGGLRLWPGIRLLRPTSTRSGSVRVVTILEPGLRARVDLPCGSASVGPGPEAPRDWPSDAPAQTDLVTTGARLRVHTSRASPGSVLLRVEREVRLAEIARESGWVHVRRYFDAGAMVDGWVRAREVRRVEPTPVLALGQHIGSPGFCGRGGSHSYHGPATLRSSTAVHDRSDGATWASARRDVAVRVEWSYGSEWVQIVEIEGLRSRSECPNLFDRAWVRRADVVIPGEQP